MQLANIVLAIVAACSRSVVARPNTGGNSDSYADDDRQPQTAPLVADSSVSQMALVVGEFDLFLSPVDVQAMICC